MITDNEEYFRTIFNIQKVYRVLVKMVTTNNRNAKGFITIKFETKHFHLDFIGTRAEKKNDFLQ